MYRLLRSLLFLLPAESAHQVTMGLFNFLCSIPLVKSLVGSLLKYEHVALQRDHLGLHFRNPVGIAAGFDKDARYIRSLEKIGFGFVEVGTVTPRPQAGNPRPRLFRLKKDTALINRMGFNNGGVDEMAGRLKRLSDRSIIVGGNIGKNKDTPLEKAHEDYLICFEKLYDLVDYFVVNVSSPNTPGLRSLQDKGPLIKILKTLINARESKDQDKPILVKIAPDLNEGQLNDIIDISNDLPIEGIIATNTTISRADLITSESELNAIGNGGLSGAPLFSRSNEVLSILKGKLSADKVLIGVGGIQDKDSALGKIRNGADLIQIYTGFVYQGPFLIKKIKKALANDLNF